MNAGSAPPVLTAPVCCSAAQRSVWETGPLVRPRLWTRVQEPPWTLSPPTSKSVLTYSVLWVSSVGLRWIVFNA